MAFNYGLFNPIKFNQNTQSEETLENRELDTIQTYADSLASTLETDSVDVVSTDEVPEERDAAGVSVFEGFLTNPEDHYGQS